MNRGTLFSGYGCHGNQENGVTKMLFSWVPWQGKKNPLLKSES